MKHFITIRITLLLGCVAVASLWGRSHFVMDELFIAARGGGLRVTSVHGTLRFLLVRNAGYASTITRGTTRLAGAEGRWVKWSAPPPWFTRRQFAGFVYGFGNAEPHIKSGEADILLEMPDWFILAVVMTGPASRGIIWCHRRRRRRAGGLCQSCGYDLRATPDRCPECGLPVTVSTREQAFGSA